MTTEPTPYRLVEVIKTDKGFKLHLDENGLEDPDTDIVLMWQDKDGVLWVQWENRDYRIDDFNFAGLDYTNDDNVEITTTVCYDQQRINNATP